MTYKEHIPTLTDGVTRIVDKTTRTFTLDELKEIQEEILGIYMPTDIHHEINKIFYKHINGKELKE